MLANAWQGYNVSLFAYGQTGSGKSYSMVGYGANKGKTSLVSGHENSTLSITYIRLNGVPSY